MVSPNTHDPLHLMDCVNEKDYEEQLSSPVKKGRNIKGFSNNIQNFSFDFQAKKSDLKSGALCRHLQKVACQIKSTISKLKHRRLPWIPRKYPKIPKMWKAELRSISSQTSRRERQWPLIWATLRRNLKIWWIKSSVQLFHSLVPG